MSDVEAIMNAKLPTWKMEHFGLWADVIQPMAEGVKAQAVSSVEILEMEDAAQAARYREVRAKLAQEVSLMTQYHAQLEENKRRSHVVSVMHERSQVQVGKELLV